MLIDDPRVRGVSLTGSEGAGSVVAARAGKNLKKSTMELGGSDALIALDDADLDKTVRWALWGRMNNGGQCCVASKRIIVAEEIADEFLEKFKAALAELKAGDPFDEATTLPPMSSQGAADELNEKMKAAVEAGATAIPLGEPVPTTGAFVQPTILTDLTPDNPAYYQEFFGPVALFFRATSEDDAVRLANDSHFGLGGSVFTQDVERGVEVAKRIETGMVFINHPTWTKPDLPFGGVKLSGYGHELSNIGIQEFVNKKLINVVPIDAPSNHRPGRLTQRRRNTTIMADFTVGKYLATRFEQIGLKHYFMVPGDYNLVLLDELLENKNVEQIGCCNELNAAYAAEGYARVNGAGAVLTTFNVGAYSALNGVAGAYAERLPVIIVSSSPNTNDPAENHILHHTMGNHDFAAQYEVFRQVTCAAVRIQHPANAPEMIDYAISTALRERKPAYIEIPCNLSAAPCPPPAPFSTLPPGSPATR